MSGDRDAFEHLVEPYRRELQLHCYRMLGSLHDAEDLVQETLLRAWRGREGFEGRASVRTWLYTIATNACLNTIARGQHARRVLPETQGPPAAQPHQGGPASEVAWLDPYPDAWLEGIADAAPGPEARYEQAEAVQLAFVAAIQRLPPRQRAVLLLRDVLAWSAGETAGLRDASVAAVNSALQRARHAGAPVPRRTTQRPVGAGGAAAGAAGALRPGLGGRRSRRRRRAAARRRGAAHAALGAVVPRTGGDPRLLRLGLAARERWALPSRAHRGERAARLCPVRPWPGGAGVAGARALAAHPPGRRDRRPDRLHRPAALRRVRPTGRPAARRSRPPGGANVRAADR